jgi:alkyldihydroxyacetonephosphate synthase
MSWLDELKQWLGPDVVKTDGNTIRQCSYDWWPVAQKWKQQHKQPFRPDAVVRPGTTDEVSRLLHWASENGIPVTPRGAGSGVTGAALAVRGGICLDVLAMNAMLALDETNLLVTAQAGMMGHILEQTLNQQGFTLNHSPQSLERSSVGGWVATRATGQFSSRWGGIEDLVAAFTVVLPTGEIVRTRLVPRAATGPDLRHVFMGSEGTLGVVTEVTLKMFPVAEHSVLEALTFPVLESGLLVMRRIMQAGLRPFLARFYDENEARYAMRDQAFNGCVMFLGFEGLRAVAEAEHQAALALCAAEGGQPLGPSPVEKWMERRFDFSAIESALARPGGIAETIEVAHLWTGILDTYRRLKVALAPLTREQLGHFSHVYPQGTSLYMIVFDQAADDAAAEERLLAIWDAAMRTCLETGAAISHHHGIGLARRQFLRQELASSAVVLERIKAALDPADIMNPGKLIFD